MKKKKEITNLYETLKEHGINKECFIKKCEEKGITQEQLDHYVETNDIPMLITIILYKILREAEEENIYFGTIPYLETKLDKRKLSGQVQYYYEDEIKYNECPLCGFSLVTTEIENTPLDVYGYSKQIFKEVKYCDSCKKYHVIYERK